MNTYRLSYLRSLSTLNLLTLKMTTSSINAFNPPFQISRNGMIEEGGWDLPQQNLEKVPVQIVEL